MKTFLTLAAAVAALATASASFAKAPAGGHWEWQSRPPHGPNKSGLPGRIRVWVKDGGTDDERSEAIHYLYDTHPTARRPIAIGLSAARLEIRLVRRVSGRCGQQLPAVRGLYPAHGGFRS